MKSIYAFFLIKANISPISQIYSGMKFYLFARVICALIFSILATEKSGCVKYAVFLWRS